VLEIVPVKVFDPVNVKVVNDPVALPMAKLLYVLPPPAKVLEITDATLENTIVDVPALSVIPVAVVKSQTLPALLVNVQVPDPIVKALVLVLELVYAVAVTLTFVVRDPAVCVIAPLHVTLAFAVSDPAVSVIAPELI
jgi:hypothetical protein